ncbi:hypothetical protein GCM10022210_56460 [Mucilaginibacter dorajii]|uniref:Uncharacterized protein n=1 Tax=Mucilaginibacter dorajii TaxID=692994 RepID=A0ABP7RAB7_9SPHI
MSMKLKFTLIAGAVIKIISKKKLIKIAINAKTGSTTICRVNPSGKLRCPNLIILKKAGLE